MGEKKSWMDKLSETVDKAAKAANDAWDGTADLRKETWAKTKTAASSAAEALDQGVEQAKRSFEGTEDPAQEEPQDDGPDEHEASGEPDAT